VNYEGRFYLHPYFWEESPPSAKPPSSLCLLLYTIVELNMIEWLCCENECSMGFRSVGRTVILQQNIIITVCLVYLQCTQVWCWPNKETSPQLLEEFLANSFSHLEIILFFVEDLMYKFVAISTEMLWDWALLKTLITICTVCGPICKSLSQLNFWVKHRHLTAWWKLLFQVCEYKNYIYIKKIGFIWLRIGTGGGLLWTWYELTLGFHKVQDIFC
jgi:hypothetical protein